MNENEEKAGSAKGLKVALVALPLLLALSTVGAVWFHWHQDTREEADPRLAMAGGGFDRAEMADSLAKLSEDIGKRDWESEDGRRRMRQVLALVEGTLSPQNYGFVVRKGGEVAHEEELWPMLWVDVRGEGDEIVCVAAPYDGDDGSLVALMTAARELRGESLRRTVRFLVYPEALASYEKSSRKSWTDGGAVVAGLRLRRLADRAPAGTPGLAVAGPDPAAREDSLEHPAVRRVVRPLKEGQDGPGGPGDLPWLIVEPEAGTADGEADLTALTFRTRVLVDLIRDLAAKP